MKVAVLFSGGKDSCYSAYKAKQAGNELTCLISIHSKNPDSYMFHTPNISLTKKQAEVMGLPLIVHETLGEKEKELDDLKDSIKIAKEKYEIEGVVTGALHSNYQAERIQKICDDLGLKCLNPLWHMDEINYLKNLIKDNFKVLIVGVAAYPLDNSWLNRIIDEKFVEDAKELKEKYKIHPAGEGGEFETFVLDCPLFKKELKAFKKNIKGEKHTWKMEIKIA
ncbi:diphthine--ammonia ligase [Candidatus Pacearchaeota archaeon]|nr:diphthine--ammonia ligase [Candidatus Pacearchaeota archaeon]